MLVLTRKRGERIFIGDSIVLTVLDCTSGKVRFGIEAPADVRVLREELWACGAPAVPEPVGARAGVANAPQL